MHAAKIMKYEMNALLQKCGKYHCFVYFLTRGANRVEASPITEAATSNGRLNAAPTEALDLVLASGLASFCSCSLESSIVSACEILATACGTC
jgi:hypothetical protein